MSNLDIRQKAMVGGTDRPVFRRLGIVLPDDGHV
jgi:hypothetical protein